MGFGDAKLALSIGFALGLGRGIYAMTLAFWIGAVCGLALMLLSKKNITMKTEIPFAPFLIIGAWLASSFDFNFLYVF